MFYRHSSILCLILVLGQKGLTVLPNSIRTVPASMFFSSCTGLTICRKSDIPAFPKYFRKMVIPAVAFALLFFDVPGLCWFPCCCWCWCCWQSLCCWQHLCCCCCSAPCWLPCCCWCPWCWQRPCCLLMALLLLNIGWVLAVRWRPCCLRPWMVAVASVLVVAGIPAVNWWPSCYFCLWCWWCCCCLLVALNFGCWPAVVGIPSVSYWWPCCCLCEAGSLLLMVPLLFPGVPVVAGEHAVSGFLLFTGVPAVAGRPFRSLILLQLLVFLLLLLAGIPAVAEPQLFASFFAVTGFLAVCRQVSLLLTKLP